MAFQRKRSHKKAYIAILLLVVLIASVVAVILATQPTSAKAIVGVHVGDTFTYSLMGTSNLSAINAVETPGFSIYNDTDNYKITITAINGSSVTLDTVWLFKNGTELPSTQTIDLSNGAKTDQNGFWAIYASNLNLGDPLRPTGHDGLTVNQTIPRTYASGSRVSNFMTIGAESYLGTDPTHNTLRYDLTGAWFDKQTGMLENLTWITQYNNPEMTEVITWRLISSSVWAV